MEVPFLRIWRWITELVVLAVHSTHCKLVANCHRRKMPKHLLGKLAHRESRLSVHLSSVHVRQSSHTRKSPTSRNLELRYNWCKPDSSLFQFQSQHRSNTQLHTMDGTTAWPVIQNFRWPRWGGWLLHAAVSWVSSSGKWVFQQSNWYEGNTQQSGLRMVLILKEHHLFQPSGFSAAIPI